MKKDLNLSTPISFKEYKKRKVQFAKDHPIKTWIRTNIIYTYYQMCFFIQDTPIHIKWWFQRANRGWSDNDAWNWYEHNAKVNSEVLYYLAHNKQGYPPELTAKEWRKMLVKMADAWYTMTDEHLEKKNTFNKCHTGVFIKEKLEFEKVMSEYYIPYYQSLWD